MKFNGLPVKDATKSLEIEIEKIDVVGSRKKDPNNCAAARALKREYKCKEVAVFSSKTYIKEGDHYVRYITPEAITREIISFDRGSEFEPGSYKLRKPSRTEKLGAERTPSNNKSSSGTKRKQHMTTNIRNWKISAR